MLSACTGSEPSAAVELKHPMGARPRRPRRPAAHRLDHTEDRRLRRHLSAKGRDLLPSSRRPGLAPLAAVAGRPGHAEHAAGAAGSGGEHKLRPAAGADHASGVLLTAHPRRPDRCHPKPPRRSLCPGARPAATLLCGDMNFPATAPERTHLLAPYPDATPTPLTLVSATTAWAQQ